MDIMVIDRDSLTNQLVTSRLEARGHKVVTFQNKNEAFDALRAGAFDCVMVDPAPLSEPKPIVIAVWRNLPPSGVRPYILLLSKGATTGEAILAGTNDVLLKPFSTDDIEVKVQNAARLMEISRHLAHEDNVHSEGGMVGKAAFNQLFHSAIDRAFRYGERSVIVFIHICNYDEAMAADPEGTAAAILKLNEKLTFTRRQSDVIGRLGAKDYAILLQRPQTESEPHDAFNRFAEMLEKFHNAFENRALAPKFELHLVEVPQGAMHAECFVPFAAADVAAEQ